MTDYIKREDAVLAIAAFLRFSQPMARRIVGSIPSADVSEQKHGEWMPIIEANEFGDAYQCGCYCSECGEELQSEPNFCPNCGADMRGDSDV